jgi:hypothetical protein
MLIACLKCFISCLMKKVCNIPKHDTNILINELKIFLKS